MIQIFVKVWVECSLLVLVKRPVHRISGIYYTSKFAVVRHTHSTVVVVASHSNLPCTTGAVGIIRAVGRRVVDGFHKVVASVGILGQRE